MKKLLTLFLCLTLTLGLFPMTALASSDWPQNTSIEAEGGIVIDADSGAVIYGKNIHERYFPASITKIMTALLVIENCELDEMVTFSQNAVYNVESGSKSLGMDTGDQLTVRDCLYGLLLHSANEVANALAEHVSGSIEEFANLMNQRAKELGCTNTNFSNPSGLNDPDHYTTAYDMALITKAAFQNETLVEIDSSSYYDIPPTKRNVEGYRIYPGHKMLKKNESVYYPGILGGKTGYTSLAGNTLVTYAQRDGMNLITVILNGHQTHYKDTKTLLDFGFNYFQSLKIADYETAYTSMENSMTIAGLSAHTPSAIILDKTNTITLPKTADFTDADSQLTYELTEYDPKNAIAKIQYTYGDGEEPRKIGAAYLQINPESLNITPTTSVTPAVAPTSEEVSSEESLETSKKENKKETVEKNKKVPFKIPSFVWITLTSIFVLAAAVGILFSIRAYLKNKEEKQRSLRRYQREQRLKESGYSVSEFDQLMEQRRSSHSTKQKRWKRK